MHRVMMEKDSIIEVSLHIRDNKINIAFKSNEKVRFASPVSQTKHFIIIAGFSKY